MPASLFLMLATFLPAQAPNVDSAMTIASSAFEYRDFEKVIVVLGPLMHPVVLIPGEARQLVARRLLGISRYATGDLDGARDEFSQLLLVDPDYELDGWKVPPQIVEAFVQQRDQMKPVLDAMILERKNTLAKPPPPGRASMFLPLGGPQLKLEQWEFGYVLGGLQVVGLAVNVAGWAITTSVYPDDDVHETGRTAMYAGLATWLTAYVVSVIVGNVMLDPPAL